jgi:proteasome lid subunit RPN8/RPN11
MFKFPESLSTIITKLNADRMEESCGYCFVDSDRNWICTQVENVAANKRDHFEFTPEDMVEYDAIATEKFIWHTHLNPKDSHLSSDDVRTAKSWPTAILMVNVNTGIWDYYDPEAPKAPYVGRKWVYSYQNCYTLIQDYYSQELAIELPDHYLESTEAWSDSSWNMFVDNISQAGFHEVDKDNPRDNDLLLFKAGRSHNPNHIGVLLSASRGEFLHQLAETLSGKETLDRNYKKRLISAWRHETLS